MIKINPFRIFKFQHLNCTQNKMYFLSERENRFDNYLRLHEDSNYKIRSEKISFISPIYSAHTFTNVYISSNSL